MNIQKYLLFGLSISIIMPNIFPEEKQEKIVLNCSIISLIDGYHFGVNGTIINDMLHSRREIRKIQFGIMNPKTKQLEGLYEFNGKKCSLHTLAAFEKNCDLELEIQKKQLEEKYLNRFTFMKDKEFLDHEHNKKLDEEIEEQKHSIKRKYLDEHSQYIERIRAERKIRAKYQDEYEKEINSLKYKHISQHNTYDRELHMILQEYNKKVEFLHNCLVQIKIDFIRVHEPFIEQARGTKQLIFKLIEESCHLRKRHDSFLLTWAEVEEGQEISAFNEQIITCRMLDLFCSDLTNFMEDLIHSCPKGWQQFLELSHQHKD